MIVLSSLQDPQLVALLTKGAIGVIPTDTIYGLCALANNHNAVKRLYALKDRELKPGTVIAANVGQLAELGVRGEDLAQVASLWPNPLSIELDVGDHLGHLHQSTGHCAFRVVADDTVRALLEQTGPLLTTSANLPGEAPANTLADAKRYFDEQIDFYVEGGDRSNRPPSTVARLAGNKLEVKRPGAVVIGDDGRIAV